jgi:hypothetical protein
MRNKGGGFWISHVHFFPGIFLKLIPVPHEFDHLTFF